MSKDDLMNLIGGENNHTLYKEFKDKIQQSTIINVYMIGDKQPVKIGKGGEVEKTEVIKITPDYFTIQYDSHKTDYMYTGIKKIEYF